MTDNEISRYIRSCEQTIRACGFDGEIDGTGVMLHTYDDDRTKWLSWAAHALWRAFRDIQEGEELYAFRGLMLAREYRGQRGGFLNSPMSDALGALRNHCENIYRRATKGE